MRAVSMCRSVLVLMSLSVPVGDAAHAATGSGSRLHEVSQDFVTAFNAADAERIHTLMTAPLRAKYSKDAILEMLAFCKTSRIARIDRTSLPVSGTRYFGFFGLYGPEVMASMLLEIDPQDRIVFVAIADDVTTGDFACSFNSFQ